MVELDTRHGIVRRVSRCLILSKDQIQRLFGLVSSVQPHGLTCDDCLGRVAEFAEASLEEREISEGLRAIQRHLEYCVCCKDEYEALVEALKEVDHRD